MTTPAIVENYQRTPPRRLKILRLTVACGGLFVPLLISVVYLAANTRFIPDPSLGPWAKQVAVFLAISVSVVLAPPMWQEYQRTAGARERLRAIVGTLALPFMTAFAGAHAVGAVASVLHEIGPSEEVRVVEPVDGSSHNGKTACDDSFNLDGDSILLRRKVCDVDFNQIVELKQGDRVELAGSRSGWGIKVREYKILSSESSDPKAGPAPAGPPEEPSPGG